MSTAVVMTGTLLRPPLSWLRDVFVRAFLASFAPAEWRGGLDHAFGYRTADAKVEESEKARLRSLRF